MRQKLESLGLWLPTGKFTPLCQQVRAILKEHTP